MNMMAVVCNALLFIFTCIVLAADSFPKEASYIVFTLWTLFTLPLSGVVIFRRKTR